MKSLKLLSVFLTVLACAPIGIFAEAAQTSLAAEIGSKHTDVSRIERLKEASERTLKETEAELQKHVAKPIEKQDKHYLALLEKKKENVKKRIALYEKKLKEVMERHSS
jgi:hypothetical protein